MGEWDELCVVCGTSPFGGPGCLALSTDFPGASAQIASEVYDHLSSSEHRLPQEEIYNIIRNAMDESLEYDEWSHRPLWQPIDLGLYLPYARRTVVAIGYFDEQKWGGAPEREEGNKCPDGRYVELRFARDGVCCNFSDVEEMVVFSDEQVKFKVPGEYSDSDAGRRMATACGMIRNKTNPNFWTCVRCYNSICAWLDQEGLPPRQPDQPTSLAGELYEIVNSQKLRRSSDSLDWAAGLLPCIDYDGVEKTLDQFQTAFYPARRGVRNLIRGISAGQRGKDLIPDIMQDFRCWMFKRINIWPEPINDATWPTLTTPGEMRELPASESTPGTIGILDDIPSEIMIDILEYLSLNYLLAFSSTCKTFRSFVTDPVFLTQYLRNALFSGELCYILPINSEESPRFYTIAQQWLRTHRGDPPPPEQNETSDAMEVPDDPMLPLKSRDFPYLPFVYACYQSDSMKNRKRIRGLVKQFEGLWREYRSRGWQVDRFFPSEELPERLKNRAFNVDTTKESLV